MRVNVLLLGLLGMCLLPAPGRCDQSLLLVDGQGEVRFSPDLAHVHIVIEATGDDLSAATANVARTRKKIVEGVARLGVSEEDVKTEQFTVRQELGTRYSAGDLIEVAPMARHLVIVTVDDFSKIGQVVDASLSSGAAGMSHISYSSSRESVYQDEALAAAVADAHRKAEIMARTAGGQLGVLIEMQANHGYTTAAADSEPIDDLATTTPTVIDPHELKAMASVRAKWEYLPPRE